MSEKELPGFGTLTKSNQLGSEPVSSSDANKAKQKAGSDSHTEEVKGASNTDEVLERMRNMEEQPRKLWQLKLEEFLDGVYFQIFVSILSIFTLFADEIRLVAFTKGADSTFYGLLTACLCIFVVEIVLSSISKEKYLNSFFFWLDIISTVSIIGDIGWIIPNNSSVGQQTTGLAKEARTARAARVARFIRLIRLVRITKLYKEAQKQKNRSGQSGITRRRSSCSSSGRVYPMSGQAPPSEESSRGLIGARQQEAHPQNPQDTLRSNHSSESEVHFKETQVSKMLSELTTERVVILIIILVFGLPLLSLDTYIYQPYLPGYAITTLTAAHSSMTTTEFAKICNTLIDIANDEKFYPLIYINGPDCGPFTYDIDADELRVEEKMEYINGDYKIIMDVRNYTKLTSGLTIGRTLFICIVLAGGAILFTHDIDKLVLGPLDSMIEKVNRLSTDPMWFCLATEDDEVGIYGFLQKQQKENEKYETTYLESLVVKIAKLLAVEFGEAGTKIIVSNLSSNDFLNPMVPGAKMCAIFGFCIINSFSQTTEILQTDTIVYLNQIAETVHATIDKYLGCTNKNIGEAFLVLWKFGEEDVDYLQGEPTAKTKAASTLADLALFSYIKIIAKINKLQHILKFAEREDMKREMPHYKLKMGFGLHVGWAIEGAVGSVYKIDASYLSPNVNIASRIEAATRQYGVPLMISGQVYEMLSTPIKKLCREIDRVTVKGSLLPIKLYTVDVDVQGLKMKECKYANTEAGRKKEKRLRKRKLFQKEIRAGQKSTQQIYDDDHDFGLMRAGINPSFLEQFNGAYKNYIDGKWDLAINEFKRVLVVRPNDGPTLSLSCCFLPSAMCQTGIVKQTFRKGIPGTTMTLLSYIEARNGVAPADWKGFRGIINWFHIQCAGNNVAFLCMKK